MEKPKTENGTIAGPPPRQTQKRHLPQIKTFKVTQCNDANHYVIEMYNKTGNVPTITHSGDYISITSSVLVQVNVSNKRTQLLKINNKPLNI